MLSTLSPQVGTDAHILSVFICGHLRFLHQPLQLRFLSIHYSTVRASNSHYLGRSTSSLILSRISLFSATSHEMRPFSFNSKKAFRMAL